MSKMIKTDPVAHARAERAAFESTDARLKELEQLLWQQLARHNLARASAKAVMKAIEETRIEIRRLQTATCWARAARSKALNKLLAKAARAR